MSQGNNVAWVLTLHSAANMEDDGEAVDLNKQDVALINTAFKAVRCESLMCRASTLQTTIGRLCGNIRASLKHTPFYGLCITVANDSNDNTQVALTQHDGRGVLAQQAAWKVLDKMYNNALETGKPLVIHAASYSASAIAELVAMHVASPLVWRWVAKDIFWEEVQNNRFVLKHGNTFSTFD